MLFRKKTLKNHGDGKKGILRRILKWTLYSFYVLFAFLILFEVAYRYQFIDFYSNELQALNSKDELSDEKKKTILVGGDSFSAHPEGYIKILKDSLKDYKVINSAIPGSGIIQASYLLPQRFRKFKPDLFIYQIYVGNDLLDINKPTNWGELSFMRNMYWSFSDYFHSISFLNYRLVQSGNAPVQVEKRKIDSDTVFKSEFYSQRQKLYLKANPEVIQNSVCLKNNRSEDLDFLKERLSELIEKLPKGCAVLIVVIPHCAQVNDYYRSNLVMLGAKFTDEKLTDLNYPFINQLKGIKCHKIFNPLSKIRENDSSSNRLYFVNDVHLSYKGQVFLGTELLKQVREVLKK